MICQFWFDRINAHVVLIHIIFDLVELALVVIPLNQFVTIGPCYNLLTLDIILHGTGFTFLYSV